jgi:DNA-binding NtrC family response regulator
VTLRHRYSDKTIAEKAEALAAVVDTMSRVAAGRTPVLIVGESQVAAYLGRAIHLASPRAWGPFIRVNCAETAPGPLAAHLFGGPATDGEEKSAGGLAGTAHMGTLLVQHIEATDSPLQLKIADVLQEHRYEPPGGAAVPVDIRLIATTAVDLAARVAAGGFREDLFYRLNVVSIVVPEILGKREDITDVIDFFRMQSKLRARQARDPKARGAAQKKMMRALPPAAQDFQRALERVLSESPGIAPEAMLSALVRTWGQPPGLVAQGEGGEATRDVPVSLEQALRECVDQNAPTGSEPFESLVDRVQRALIAQVLERFGGAQAKAAEFLGITPMVLDHKMRELHLK